MMMSFKSFKVKHEVKKKKICTKIKKILVAYDCEKGKDRATKLKNRKSR